MGLPKKYDYYLKFPVTPGHLEDLEDSIETAIDRLLAFRGMKGLLGPIHGITPGTGFTIDLTSNDGTNKVRGFDANGNYVAVDAEPYTSDDLAALFTLPGVGEEKWITFVLRFTRVASDPRTEFMTFVTVNLLQSESFEIGVVSGAAAGVGAATKPSLAAEDGLYLGDCLLTDASADFSINPPVIAANRHRKDGLHEVSLRGLDGVNEILALVTPDFQDAIDNTVGADAGNPLATVDDAVTIANTIGGEVLGSIAGSVVGSSAGAYNLFTWVYPVDTAFIELTFGFYLGLFGGITMEAGKGIIDTAAGTFTGSGIAGSIGGSQANYTFNGVPIVTPFAMVGRSKISFFNNPTRTLQVQAVGSVNDIGYNWSSYVTAIARK
jgi:hypothetical protein